MKFKFSLKRNKEPHASAGAIQSREYVNPARDWLIMLSCATLLFIGGVTYSSIDFYNQLDARAGDMSAQAQPLIYAEMEVIQYARMYTKREEMFTMLRSDRSFVPQVLSTEEVDEEEQDDVTISPTTEASLEND